jgi:hypothetical protein
MFPSYPSITRINPRYHPQATTDRFAALRAALPPERRTRYARWQRTSALDQALMDRAKEEALLIYADLITTLGEGGLATLRKEMQAAARIRLNAIISRDRGEGEEGEGGALLGKRRRAVKKPAAGRKKGAWDEGDGVEEEEEEVKEEEGGEEEDEEKDGEGQQGTPKRQRGAAKRARRALKETAAAGGEDEDGGGGEEEEDPRALQEKSRQRQRGPRNAALEEGKTKAKR